MDGTEQPESKHKTNRLRAFSFLDPNEAVPTTSLYYNPEQRPSIKDVLQEPHETDSPLPMNLHESQHLKPKSENPTFYWLFSVFFPVLLNHLSGAYLPTNPIKSLGFTYAFLSFTFSFIISAGTLSSLCAITTNGEMDTGGIYYIISRNLGPTFGGTVGIMMIIAHSATIATGVENWIDFVHTKPILFASDYWDKFTLKAIALVVIHVLCLFGIAVILIICTISAAVSLFSIIFNFFNAKPQLTLFNQNAFIHNPKIFALITSIAGTFSGNGGVVTCANFSGNIKDKNGIPKGGFWSLLLATLLILTKLILDAFSIDFTLPQSLNAISCIGISFQTLGICITFVSGGIRIASAMIQDKMLNLPHWCCYFFVLFTFCFNFIGDTYVLTHLTTILYMIPFALVNIVVYISSSIHYPGFRPTFKYFNRWISLATSIFCLIKMILTDWQIAIITFIIFLLLVKLFDYLHPRDIWGTVMQAKLFDEAIDEQLALYFVEPHPKTFRPNIFLAIDSHPDNHKVEIDFLNQVLHRHGMVAIGRVVATVDEVDFGFFMEERNSTFLNEDNKFRTFYDVYVAPTFHEGVRDLLLGNGIGALRANTLALIYKEDIDKIEFFSAITTAFDANLNLFVMRNIEEREGNIDVWWLSDDGGLTLLLPYLLSKHQKHSNLRVIQVAYVDEGEEYTNTQKRMVHLLYKFRINAEIITIELSLKDETVSMMTLSQWNRLGCPESSLTHRYLLLTDLLREYSSGSAFVALSMIVPPKECNYKLYMGWLEVLSNIGIPFGFIRGNGESALSWKV